MEKTAKLLGKMASLFLIALFVFLMAHANALAGNTTTNPAGMSSSYEKWRSVGEFAAETALDLIGLRDRSRGNMEKKLVVLVQRRLRQCQRRIHRSLPGRSFGKDRGQQRKKHSG